MPPPFHTYPHAIAYPTREDWIAETRDLGREAGRNAASWAADGNTTDEHRRTVLALMEAGDPEADIYLPQRPHLSGDEQTPDCVYREVTGRDEIDTAEDIKLRDALAEAWEEGARDVFELECERVLHAGLADTDGGPDIQSVGAKKGVNYERQ